MSEWKDSNESPKLPRKSHIQRLTLQRSIEIVWNISCDVIWRAEAITSFYFLSRMGSFNSAPKINNVDSQDDAIQVPTGLSIQDFVYHCKMMRGENRPQLLTRSFLKAPTVPNLAADVTDGMRFLNLDSVSKTCSPPGSPKHIRLLQWNILSQCKWCLCWFLSEF